MTAIRDTELDWELCVCDHAYLLHVHEDAWGKSCLICGPSRCEHYEAPRGPWWAEMWKNVRRGWRRG